MVSRYSLFLIFKLALSFTLFGQQDYNSFYRNTNPAKDSLDPEVKKAIYADFIQEASDKQDTLKIILGNMYLANAFVIESNYTAAMENLIQAGNCAVAIEDTLLIGRINHKKAAVFFLMQNHEEAIKRFEISLSESTVAQDSQFIAITLEQLGLMYSYLEDYEQANIHYEKAIPLVEKYWDAKALATTLSNYGSPLVEQDSVFKAIKVYRRAIALNEQIQDIYEIIPAKQNMAYAFMLIDSLEEALQLYQECRTLDEANGWLNYLVYAYEGISMTYSKMGKLDSALHYFKKYHVLRDSTFGTSVQNKIGALETENEIQKKDIEILRKNEAVLLQRQKMKNILAASLTLITVGGIGLWLLWRRKKRIQLSLEENRKSLQQLTKLLQTKNAELRDMRSQLAEKDMERNGEMTVDLEKINLYEMKILTHTDWDAFKVLFEKSYPKYLQKIRRAFPDITEAEERLFLFLKLQLTTREAADILGIQPQTIKKTRLRLRKRLGLATKENLDDFIQNFG